MKKVSWREKRTATGKKGNGKRSFSAGMTNRKSKGNSKGHNAEGAKEERKGRGGIVGFGGCAGETQIPFGNDKQNGE